MGSFSIASEGIGVCEQSRAMPGSSKLARRMKLKKKIEEEFRLAEERGKVEKVSLYDNYWARSGQIERTEELKKEDKYQSENSKNETIKHEVMDKQRNENIEDKIVGEKKKEEENTYLETSTIKVDENQPTKKENVENKQKLKKKSKEKRTRRRRAVEEKELSEVEQL